MAAQSVPQLACSLAHLLRLWLGWPPALLTCRPCSHLMLTSACGWGVWCAGDERATAGVLLLLAEPELQPLATAEAPGWLCAREAHRVEEAGGERVRVRLRQKGDWGERGEREERGCRRQGRASLDWDGPASVFILPAWGGWQSPHPPRLGDGRQSPLRANLGLSKSGVGGWRGLRSVEQL